MLLAALWGWLPESPRFLHEKGRLEDFKAALLLIARVNGKPQALAAIEQAMEIAPSSAQKEEAGDSTDRDNSSIVEAIEKKEAVSVLTLVTDRRYLVNTVILCLLWSTSAYAFYFTEFYMKYVPVSNIYYLALLLGTSDILTNLTFGLLNHRLPTKTTLTISTLMLTLSSLALSLDLNLEGLTVFGLRFFSALTFIAVYYANNEYFPTLLKGAIFAVTNVAARLASVLSPVVAEGLSNPSVTVALAAGAACIASVSLYKISE